MFVIFFHVSYRFWPLNQNILIILWHQLLLYLIRNTVQMLLVWAILRLIELEVGQQRPLQIKTPYGTGVWTQGRLSLLPLHVLLLFTLSHTEHIILYNLNAAIQKSESNQHSDKTLLQEWVTLLTWSND